MSERLDPYQILDLTRQHMDEENAKMFAKIALAESGGEIEAVGDEDAGYSYGLWQINHIHLEDLIMEGIIRLDKADQGIIEEIREGRADEIGWKHEYHEDLWSKYAPQLFNPSVALEAAIMVGQRVSYGGDIASRVERGLLVDENTPAFDEWSTSDNLDAPGKLMDNTEWHGMSPNDVIDAITQEQYLDDPQEFQLGQNFWERLNRARDDADIKFTPFHALSNRNAFNQLRDQIKVFDPDLFSHMINPDSGFTSGNATFVDYNSEDDMANAPELFRRYGLQTHPEMPWIVSTLGQGRIDREGDIASQLWDRAIASLGSQDTVI